MLRRILVALVLAMIVEEGVGGKEGSLCPLLFVLGWVQLVEGAW